MFVRKNKKKGRFIGPKRLFPEHSLRYDLRVLNVYVSPVFFKWSKMKQKLHVLLISAKPGAYFPLTAAFVTFLQCPNSLNMDKKFIFSIEKGLYLLAQIGPGVLSMSK